MSRDAPITWALGGGAALLVVWRDDTGESVVTARAALAGPLDDGAEYVTAGDGTARRRSGGPSLAVDVFDWPSAAALRRWAADGARVRARLIGRTTAPHDVWDEPVAVVLSPVRGDAGARSGVRLRLSSAKPRAAVSSSPDLLDRVAFGDGGDWAASGSPAWGVDGDGAATVTLDADTVETTVDLPAPGLAVALVADVVENDGVSLEALPQRFSGLNIGAGVVEPVLGAGVKDAVLGLPDGTHRVRLRISGSGVVRLPALLTRKPDGSPIHPAEAAGLLGLQTSTAGDTTTITSTSPASITANPDGTATIAAPDRAFGPTRAGRWIQTLYTDD